MLTHLLIRNFAIIEEQTVSFSRGLNVISGETGSGKSILLAALELILGGKINAHAVRDQAKPLEVEAAFDLSDVAPDMRRELPELVEGEELVVSRSISTAGKGKIYINGRLGTVSLLDQITSRLINVCRQGHQLRLLEPKHHRELVDGFGEHFSILASFSAAYQRWLDLEERHRQALKGLAHSEARFAELHEIVTELEAVKLHEGVRAELEAEIKLLENSEKLLSQVRIALDLLSGEGELLACCNRLNASLQDAARFDSKLERQAQTAAATRIELQELERTLNSYLDRFDLDRDSLEKLRDELAEVARLERKYRCDDAGLVSIREKSKLELKMAEEPADIVKIEQDLRKAEKEALQLAHTLSAARKRTARDLVHRVEKDLKDLNMADASLQVHFETSGLTSNGIDEIEILIASNKGETLKPLRQVASGGELSRITLALKKNLRDRSHVNVLVFDEVDSGVSGKVARSMGQMLKELAKSSQVICITHLAQIASLAEHHLLVDKQVGKRAVSVVREISGAEKVDEIARMLAGYNITPAARESARELLASKK